MFSGVWSPHPTRGEIFIVSSDIDEKFQLFPSLGCFTQAWFKGICVSDRYALFGVAQIALERSRRRRGRRMPAPDAPTSRFAPPPPRALIPVSESCIFLYLIPFDSVICSGTGLLLSPSTVISFYLTSKVTLYYSARRFVFFFLFLIPLKHFRFKDLQQLQVLISKGQALVGTSLQFWAVEVQKQRDLNQKY